MSSRKLAVADIADLRAYERERPRFLEHIIELKRRRRIAVGPYVTLVFENRDTVRFQIQEMARIERLITDEAIQVELDIYNPLIPEPGQLCATVFVELTSEALLREWLAKLVGIEQSVVLRLAGGREVRAGVDDAHDAQLTRVDVTSSVHYVRFNLDTDDIAAFAAGPVTLALDHPAYGHGTELSRAAMDELVGDLRT
jgi:hypothetical protein